MDQHTHSPAPHDEPTFTLYRFCLSRRLALSDQERSLQGIELSKLARQRQLTFPTVREQVGRFRIKARLYPESFLNEWLALYTHAQAKAIGAPEGSPKPPAPQLTPDSRDLPTSSARAAARAEPPSSLRSSVSQKPCP